MEIRKAVSEDLTEILKIYADARRFMAENGNGGQWGNTYPPEETLRGDVGRGKLYVCLNDEKITAVFYFAVEDDPTYLVIEEGRWLSEKPYGVVHRIASARETRGAASFCLNWAFEQTGNIRIDTHENNIPMQNLLKKLGFRYCGRIHLANGDPRIAFQRVRKVVVSACLLGENCKYDGGNNHNEKIMEFLKDREVIPVCPEVWGGLPVPRIPVELVNGTAVNRAGENVDAAFRTGVQKVLDLIEGQEIGMAVLQSRSPSCGVKQIYDGSFTGKLKEGRGLLAEALSKAGIRVVDADEISG